MGLSFSAFRDPDQLQALRQLLTGGRFPQLETQAPVDQDSPAPEILTRVAPPQIAPGGVQAVTPQPTLGAPFIGGAAPPPGAPPTVQPVRPQPTLGAPRQGGLAPPLLTPGGRQPVRPQPTLGPRGDDRVLGEPLQVDGNVDLPDGRVGGRVGVIRQLLGLQRPQERQEPDRVAGITRGPEAAPTQQGRPRRRRAPFRQAGGGTQRLGRPGFVEDRLDLEDDQDPRSLRTGGGLRVPRQTRSRFAQLLRRR